MTHTKEILKKREIATRDVLMQRVLLINYIMVTYGEIYSVLESKIKHEI